VPVKFANVLAGRNDVVCIERACQAQGDEACLFELLPAGAAGDAPVVALSADPAWAGSSTCSSCFSTACR
jgi:hypothetical protein